MSSFRILCFVLVAFLPSVQPFPTGAGACIQGSSSALGHPSSPQPLTSGGFQVTLDSVPLTPGTAASFVVGQDHVLSLTSSSGYKGILFRLGGAATASSLSLQPGESVLRLASDVCGNAGGVTHNSADLKTVSSVILRLNSAATNLPLDITVVVQFADHYYAGFTLNAVTNTGANTPPTPRPVAPTRKPVTPTGASPVASSPTTPTAASSPVRPSRRPSTRRPTRRPTVHPVGQRPSISRPSGPTSNSFPTDDRRPSVPSVVSPTGDDNDDR